MSEGKLVLWLLKWGRWGFSTLTKACTLHCVGLVEQFYVLTFLTANTEMPQHRSQTTVNIETLNCSPAFQIIFHERIMFECQASLLQTHWRKDWYFAVHWREMEAVFTECNSIKFVSNRQFPCFFCSSFRLLPGSMWTGSRGCMSEFGYCHLRLVSLWHSKLRTQGTKWDSWDWF